MNQDIEKIWKQEFEKIFPKPHPLSRDNELHDWGNKLEGYLFACKEINKWKRMALCTYEHKFLPVKGNQRFWCNKCGWMQSMTELVD